MGQHERKNKQNKTKKDDCRVAEGMGQVKLPLRWKELDLLSQRLCMADPSRKEKEREKENEKKHSSFSTLCLSRGDLMID